MTGLSRYSLRPIGNLDSALQGVEFILATRIGELVMTRQFGGGIEELLGRAISVKLMLLVRQLIALAIDLWEPRFSVRKVSLSGTVDEVRTGSAHLVIQVDWRPRALFQDFTVDRQFTFSLGLVDGRLAANPL